MRTNTLTVYLTLILSLSSLSAFAGGIPTVSVAELTQMIKNAQQQARESLAQLEKAKESILQAKNPI